MKTLYILFSLLFIACSNSSSHKEDILATQELKDKIVIVFDSVPDTQVKILDNNGMFSLRNMCSYINDDFEEVSFLYPEQFNVNDTIEINTQRESVVFSVSFFGGLSTINFLLNSNNSYHIGYNDTIPYIKDHQSYSHINTYYQTLYHQVYDDKMGAERKLSDFGPMAFIKGKDRFPTQDEMDKVLPSIFKKVEDEVAWQKNHIDSLYSLNKIGNEEYTLLKSELDLKKYVVVQNIKESKFLQSFQDKYKEDWEFRMTDDMHSDSDIYLNPNFYNLMYRYNDLDRYYFDENNYSVSLMHNALADENINLKLNKTVISKFLDQVFAETTWDIIKRNSEEYINIYPESELPDYLMTKYNIDSTTVNDVVLEDVDGRKTTLEKVLNEVYGKDVVLDVWASWCAPCIHKIVTGKEEREVNKEEGVEYVFITYFDKKSDWLKKIDELGLKSEKHCYFTANSKTSEWFKDMKISSIPCIITYDKAGKVVGMEN